LRGLSAATLHPTFQNGKDATSQKVQLRRAERPALGSRRIGKAGAHLAAKARHDRGPRRRSLQAAMKGGTGCRMLDQPKQRRIQAAVL